MPLLRISCNFITALFFLTITTVSVAQNIPNISQLSIPYSNKSVIIDGEMNDDIWQDALVIPLTIVNSPLNNEKSPVDTQARIIENGQFIYVSFIAQDPHPENIQGFLADRDSTWSEDLVGIKLDTFNSRQLNYNFFVNPFGVQNDSIANEITGETNYLWDGIWQSYGKKTATGYQVEIAIPYHILNFDENNDLKTWAIELVRLYPRDERLRISHISLDRNNDCWVCQMPEITGFKNTEIGNNILLTPALVASNNQTRDIYTPSDNWHKNDDINAGIDLRWGPNANTLVNVTLNPDF
ncbi:MAG: carbohydrate binding family 9 domain-containing protein, partial [Colwellia sp.]|nr:carbohydrate binding family 9 domain-containing protein [Colwellia sp.]